MHLRPGRALRPAGEERPERRHLERRRRHRQRPGVQEHPVLPLQPRATDCWSTRRAKVEFEIGHRAGFAGAVQRAGRRARLLRFLRPRSQRRARQVHAPLPGGPRCRPPGRSGSGSALRSPRATTRRPSTNSSTAWSHARHSAERLSLRLLLDEGAALVRFRVGSRRPFPIPPACSSGSRPRG